MFLLSLSISTILDENSTVLDGWIVGLFPDEIREDISIRQTNVEKSFSLTGIDLMKQNVSLKFTTNHEDSVAIYVMVQLLSERIDEGVIYGSIILVVLYLCICLELAHRTVIAMVAATFTIAVLATLNERPSLANIISWLDIETLTLLFSMMIIVSILSETGAFNYLGMKAFKITHGKVWPLLAVLCAITAVISAFLDNVTTILLMTPVVIQLCECIHIDAGMKNVFETLYL